MKFVVDKGFVERKDSISNFSVTLECSNVGNAIRNASHLCNYTTPHKFVLMYITIVSLKSNVMWFGLVQLNELCEVFYNVGF